MYGGLDFTWEAPEVLNQQLASQPKDKEMSLGKETSAGHIPSWPSTSMCQGAACMLDACGLLHKYGDTLKMPAGLMNLFQALCIAHCVKEGK